MRCHPNDEISGGTTTGSFDGSIADLEVSENYHRFGILIDPYATKIDKELFGNIYPYEKEDKVTEFL